jgi:hypothetical protein
MISVMRMRTRALATTLAVLALLVPAMAAHADPVRAASVAASEPTLYPAVDGIVDTTQISGDVTSSAGTERIRGTVVVTIGTRVAKTWVLSSTGPFSFTWDGKIAGSIVAGTYKVTVRADGVATPPVATFVVSPKKVTAVTYTKTRYPNENFDCWDDLNLGPFDPGWSTHQTRICAFQFPGTGQQGILTLKGTKAVGPVYYKGYLDLPLAVVNSLRDPVVSVTATFTQSGSGSNALWVCLDYGCPAVAVKAFTRSTTVTASARQNEFVTAPQATVSWMLRVAHGHDLTVKAWKIKVIYYALR